MSGLLAVLLAASLGPSGAASGDWSAVLAVASGWGGRPGIYADSTGRNVAMNPQNGGPPGWYCKESPLPESRIRSITTLISGIPTDVLKKGGLVIQGLSCADEPVNVLTLTIQKREYNFSYSQIKSCRDGQEVPKWLSQLVHELWTRYLEIERCTLTPFEAEEAVK